MYTIPPVRPDISLERIHSAIKKDAERVHLIPRKRLTWAHKGHQQLYFILNGHISVLRASDGLLIVTVSEPHLFGIAEMIQPVRGHILRTESETTLLRIDAERARVLITEHNLWEEVAAVLAYHTSYLLYRDALVLQQGTYSVIRNHLQDMMLLPEETRMKISILSYIQERTHLSRSSVLNIISALRKGNYIDFKRGGFLLSASELPERF